MVVLSPSATCFASLWLCISAQYLHFNLIGLRSTSTSIVLLFGRIHSYIYHLFMRIFIIRQLLYSTDQICLSFFFLPKNDFQLNKWSYFGLKSLIKPVQNNFIPIVVLNEVDALLNPIALLLCYYTSVIFLQDIHKHKVKRKLSENNWLTGDFIADSEKFVILKWYFYFSQESSNAHDFFDSIPLKSHDGKDK